MFLASLTCHTFLIHYLSDQSSCLIRDILSLLPKQQMYPQVSFFQQMCCSLSFTTLTYSLIPSIIPPLIPCDGEIGRIYSHFRSGFLFVAPSTYFCLLKCTRVSGLNGQLAPPLFGRRKSNESVPPAVYLDLRNPLGGKEGVRLAAFVMKPSTRVLSRVVT